MPIRQHPMRDRIEQELQQGFFSALPTPCRVRHFMLTRHASSQHTERQVLHDLANQHGFILQQASQQAHVQWPGGQLRIQFHTEYSSYSFIDAVPSAVEQWFNDPYHDLPCTEFFSHLPGQVLRVHQLLLLPPPAITPVNTSTILSPHMVHEFFHHEHMIGSVICQGRAEFYTDFVKHPEGAGRSILRNQGLTDDEAARLVQQLCDIGNYRKLSLLGLTMAQQAMQQLHDMELQLAELNRYIAEQPVHSSPSHAMVDNLANGPADKEPPTPPSATTSATPSRQPPYTDTQLLAQLSQLAANTEHLIAHSSTRLHASVAYYQLTMDKIGGLDEQHIAGLLSLREFTARRLTPAYRTVTSVQQRQRNLSQRLGRVTELLRTRVNLRLQQQNTQILQNLSQRAGLQLQLQRTVEPLSVVALGYYSLACWQELAAPLRSWLPQWPWPQIQHGVIVIVVFLCIAQLWRLKRHAQTS